MEKKIILGGHKIIKGMEVGQETWDNLPNRNRKFICLFINPQNPKKK